MAQFRTVFRFSNTMRANNIRIQHLKPVDSITAQWELCFGLSWPCAMVVAM